MQPTISTNCQPDKAIMGMPITDNPDVELFPDNPGHFEALMTQALTIAHNTPDVRKERVELIRAQIERGEYQIDPASIAESLIRENPGLFEE